MADLPSSEDLRELLETAGIANAPYGFDGEKRLVGFVLPCDADPHTTLTRYINAVSAMRAEVLTLRTRISTLERERDEGRKALAEATKVRPTEACPSCGNWYEMGDCRHFSSGEFGTLYGVCKKCADNHAAFSATLAHPTIAEER